MTRINTPTCTPDAARKPLNCGPAPFGQRLRTWRQCRHLNQQGLAQEADRSTCHLSFVDAGRAEPSREMLLRQQDSHEPDRIPWRDPAQRADFPPS